MNAPLLATHADPVALSIAPPAQLQWLNRYHALGPDFYTPQTASPLTGAHWIAVDAQAGRLLGWSDDWWRSPGALEVFSGAACWPGMQPLAGVYSGHQFGVWAGQLGDGRALLLGEVRARGGTLEIQLKGSGLTPYSRMGDGRAVLRSSLREFLGSHAMHALGVPTTLALCLVGSSEPVQRETVETAAVLTRLAPSFVRFGHFEHFAYTGQHDALRRLADHLIEAHVPALARHRQPYLGLLQHAVSTTAQLMASWQALGFCHGVMNTDNMSMLGLTLDYGPFGFLDAYDPLHVCNHSDTQGRYAFARQPSVAFWNLCALGQAMQPLLADREAVVQAVEDFPPLFATAMLEALRRKLGLATPWPEDAVLIDAWLQLLHRQRVDYTLAFRALSDLEIHAGRPLPALHGLPLAGLFSDVDALGAWLQRYHQRLEREARSDVQRRDAMRATNPRFILRNHLAHTAIEHAQRGDPSEIERLLQVLSSPYDDQPQFDAYAGLPPEWACQLELSCSS